MSTEVSCMARIFSILHNSMTIDYHMSSFQTQKTTVAHCFWENISRWVGSLVILLL